MAVVHIGAHSISYAESGAGPPIILLHGWPLDSREFVRQLEVLSDAHRVIAWDAPGAGGSSDPALGASLDDWADWLAEFVETLGLDDAHIGGLSWGGGLALAFAHRHPSLVRSLVLMSAYAGWAGSLPEHEVQRRLALTIDNSNRPPGEWVPAMLETLLPPGSRPQLAEELTAMLSDRRPESTRTALAAFAQADLRAALSEIEAPTLMLYGELDVRSPREVWEPIRDAIPNAKLVVIPGVGHMVDMQSPDRCNTEIRNFVEHVEGDAAGLG